MVVDLLARVGGSIRHAAAPVAVLVLLAFSSGCGRPPPPSQFPTAAAALARMHATYACSRGVRGDAKLDLFNKQGRVRGNVLYLAMLPDSLSFTVWSPFGVRLSQLTSDGQKFSLFDMRNKVFLYGPANTCNVERFTQVPVPPFALVELLRGEAPVLVHQPSQASIVWDDPYTIRIQSKHQATEKIVLEPASADWNLPWQKQRVRVLEVDVSQQGIELYRALMEDHQPSHTAKPIVDSDHLMPDVPPSGPVCSAAIPRRVRLEVPGTDQDLILVNKAVVHNPPIVEGAFRQKVPGGVQVRYAACGR